MPSPTPSLPDGPVPDRAGVGLIVNPRARRHRQAPDLAAQLGSLLPADGSFAVTVDPEALRAAVLEFRRARVELLVISGGDGTASAVLSQLEGAYGAEPFPRVLLLPTGTMNTIAFSAGVPRQDPARLLKGIIRRHSRGRPLRSSPRVTLAVEDGSIRRLGFLFSTGIAYSFLEEYYRAGSGGRVAAKVLARLALSTVVQGPLIRRVAARVAVELTVAEAVLAPFDYQSVLAGTVPDVGLGFRLFHRLQAGDERFQIVAVHGTNRGLLRRLYRPLQGRSLGPDVAIDQMTSTAMLVSRSGPIRYSLDGEMFASEKMLRLSVGPRLRLVLGPAP